MAAITLRLDQELSDLLKYESIRSGKSQNAIIKDALKHCLEKDQKSLEAIKKAVVLARAKGRRSQEESLDLAGKAAALDDAEGLGAIKVVRSRAKRKR